MMSKTHITEENVFERLERDWVHTLTTSSDKEGHFTYWFGRKDRSDNMAPTKIEAIDAKEAWLKLDEWLEGLRS